MAGRRGTPHDLSLLRSTARREHQITPIEQIRIRVELAGMMQKELGELIGLDDPNRAWEFFTGEGAFRDLHELRHKARAIVAELMPCPRGVFRILAHKELGGPLAGVMIRWTRIILDIPLRAWGRRHGKSSAWWSMLENGPGRSREELKFSLGSGTLARIEDDMIAAVVKMWEVPSWRPLDVNV